MLEDIGDVDTKFTFLPWQNMAARKMEPGFQFESAIAESNLCKWHKFYAIIGGGILGLSIAYEVVRRGLDWRVAVIRKAHEGRGASEAAGAMLSGPWRKRISKR